MNENDTELMMNGITMGTYSQARVTMWMLDNEPDALRTSLEELIEMIENTLPDEYRQMVENTLERNGTS